MNVDEEKKALAKEQALTKAEQNQTYNSLIEEKEQLASEQSAYLDTAEQTQKDIADKQLAYNVSELERDKTEADKTYRDEAKQAQTEYTKFVNPYGVEAEKEATSGLNNQGYSESAKAMAFNAAQNRISSAKATTSKIVADFDSQISQARISNDATLAQNALTIMEQKLANNLSTFEYTSTMKLQQQQAETTLDNTYYAKLQDIYNREYAEKTRLEAIRQWEEEFKFSKQQYADSIAAAKAASYSYGSGSSSSGSYSPLEDTSGSESQTAKDLKEGAFSNGYQPDNYKGHKLSKSGYKLGDIASNAGSLSNYNVWYANGYYMYWDGQKYVGITSEVKQYKANSSSGSSKATSTKTTTSSKKYTPAKGKAQTAAEKLASDKLAAAAKKRIAAAAKKAHLSTPKKSTALTAKQKAAAKAKRLAEYKKAKASYAKKVAAKKSSPFGR